MQFTGSIADISFDMNGKPRATLLINERNNFLDGVDSLRDIKLTIDLKKYRQKRSLDANAFFWVLCGKLADKVGVTKSQVYRELIKDIGDNYEVVPIKNEAVDKWISNWESKGIGWVCDILGESKIDGYTNVLTYYGSSTYDTKQMSVLINRIVDECKAEGIETATPQELSLLLEGWSR